MFIPSSEMSASGYAAILHGKQIQFVLPTPGFAINNDVPPMISKSFTSQLGSGTLREL